LQNKYFKIPKLIPHFWDFFFFWKMARFFVQKLNFILFYQNLIGKRFYKNFKRKWFSKFHCEVQKQLNLDLSFRRLNPSPLHKSYLHIKFLVLDPWPPGSSKSPIFPNFEVNLTKYIRNLKFADHGRTLFGPSTILCRKITVGFGP
jgi:hypothetical protein